MTRVELRGAATILDVAYNARTVPQLEETWVQKIWDLQTELRQCHRQIEALNGRLSRLEKQRSVLDTFADGMTRKTEEEVFAAALPQQPPAPPQHDRKHDKHSKKSQQEENYAANLAKRSMSEVISISRIFQVSPLFLSNSVFAHLDLELARVWVKKYFARRC